jgi:predicted DNA-binding transcriptional regulator AlpA
MLKNEKYDNIIRIEGIAELRDEIKEVKAILDEIRQTIHPRRYIRSKELSRLLGISESSLQNMRNSGVLPYYKIQGTILYNYEEVVEAIENLSVNTKDHENYKC